MRLINTTTLELKVFFDSDIPPYAILSHRWGEDELTHKEYVKGRHQAGPGYQKILDLCRLAREGFEFTGWVYADGWIEQTEFHAFEWAWIDTVCIDKSSSAELSEAINSMYRWYANSGVCLVFLPDVTAAGQSTHRSDDGEVIASEDDDCIVWDFPLQLTRKHFMASVWFTRGWTLQELVAPEFVLFYDTKLQVLGWKDDDHLRHLVAEAAYMDASALHNREEVSRCCVAEKLSWAARRRTSRAEDMAYCLLGLCGVNMPLLYGEGLHGAFRRLQLEIIASSTDHSILAFDYPKRSGVLAHSPSEFARCGALQRIPKHEMFLHEIKRDFSLPIHGAQRVFSRTQRGLEFDVVIPKGIRPRYDRKMFAWLPVAYQITSKSTSQLSCLVFWLHNSGYTDGCMRGSRSGIWNIPISALQGERQVWEWLFGWKTPNTAQRSGELEEFLTFHIWPDEKLSLRDRGRKLLNELLPAKTVRVYVQL